MQGLGVTYVVQHESCSMPAYVFMPRLDLRDVQDWHNVMRCERVTYYTDRAEQKRDLSQGRRTPLRIVDASTS